MPDTDMILNVDAEGAAYGPVRLSRVIAAHQVRAIAVQTAVHGTTELAVAAKAGVQEVTQGIPEHVCAKHRERQGNSRPEG